jgi:hypothetical protein
MRRSFCEKCRTDVLGGLITVEAKGSCGSFKPSRTGAEEPNLFIAKAASHAP